MKTSKQMLAWVTSALLAVWSALPQAAFAASGTIDLTVTATCTRAITITNNPTPYNFGSVALNITTHSTRAVSVANPASPTATCADTWSLQVTGNAGGGTAWSAAAAAATDGYELRAVFASAQPVSGDFTDTEDSVRQAGPDTCTATKFVSTGDCTAIAPGDPAQNLWFQLDMPTGSVDTAPGAHTITVTVSTL